MKNLLAGLLVLAAAACAHPTTVTRSLDTRPAVAIAGAPPGATLFVDGLDMGSAAAYDGRPAVLRLEPGTHEVVVRDPAGNVITRQKVFLESELKTIQVH